MQRYWDAETTSKEEWELARYVARADDPEFDELRGVLGYLSIGKEKKARRASTVRLLPLVAAAASIAAVVAIGFTIRNSGTQTGEELYVCYSYGEKTTDNQHCYSPSGRKIGGSSPAEINLFEMFER